jgi:creatinine amidohydrolase
MAETEWRKLRADQLRDLSQCDAIVILPVASLEQHGPHLPVEVDSMLGETVAARTAAKIAARGQAVVVLPVLWTGLSEHHMSFGGTITLDNAAFAALVEGVVRSVLRHGFRKIVLLNAHGGNENALRSITDDLTPKLGVPIVQLTYWYAAAVAIAKILETQGGLSHACEAETSMMMAVRPELVAEDRIPLAKSNATGDIAAGVYRWRSIGSRSPSGVIGNPEAATRDKGERLFDAISSAVADKLCDKDLWDLPWDSEKS